MPKIKRLTRLKISSVDAVDRWAGEGVKIMLMKRDGGKKRKHRIAGFDSAGQFVDADGVPDWKWKSGGIAKVDPDETRLAKARAEIEANKEFAARFAATTKTENIMPNVITTMSTRLSEIRKAQPNLTEGAALLKLAESRNPADQELWRTYKSNIALPSSIEKSVKVKKTLKTMNRRIDEMMAADTGIKSREVAIGKIASSRLPSDAELWRDYRIASQQVTNEALPHSEPAPVGKGKESIVFDNLCRAMRDSFPGISSAQVRQWAQAVMAGNPPTEMLTVTRDACMRSAV